MSKGDTGRTKPDFQEPSEAVIWLNCALDVEREKRTKCPVQNDIFGKYVSAQAWGYVIAAYSLAEQALKCLLYSSGSFDAGDLPPQVRRTHKLRDLFDRLDDDDRSTLRNNYDDYRGARAREGHRSLPPTVGGLLDVFDGPDGRGSFDWRYSLTEDSHGVPQLGDVYLDHLWEVIECVIDLIGVRAYGFTDRPQPYSIRQWRTRQQMYPDWIFHMSHEEPGWKGRDRIELWWGPDHKNRYDFAIFSEGKCHFTFDLLPETATCVEDKRQEVNEYRAQHEE